MAELSQDSIDKLNSNLEKLAGGNSKSPTAPSDMGGIFEKLKSGMGDVAGRLPKIEGAGCGRGTALQSVP